jgi:hypothetical protein
MQCHRRPATPYGLEETRTHDCDFMSESPAAGALIRQPPKRGRAGAGRCGRDGADRLAVRVKPLVTWSCVEVVAPAVGRDEMRSVGDRVVHLAELPLLAPPVAHREVVELGRFLLKALRKFTRKLSPYSLN